MRSFQVAPASGVWTSAPASIAAKAFPEALGSKEIQRTWLVSGLGGKLHSGAEGNPRNPLSSSHVSPPSSEL